MRCDGYKLLLGRFWLDTEGKLISQGEQSAIWNDLLKEVVDSPIVDIFVQKSDSRQCSWIPLLESIQQFRATKSDENWFHTTHTCNSTWIRSFLCDGISYTSKERSNCLNIDQLLSFQWHILWMLQTLLDTVQHHYDIWAPVLYWK